MTALTGEKTIQSIPNQFSGHFIQFGLPKFYVSQVAALLCVVHSHNPEPRSARDKDQNC